LAGSIPYKKFGYLQNNEHSSGNLSQNRDLKKFRHGTSTVAGVVNFLRLTTVPCLSHRTSIFVYSATAVRRAGPSAAADTFFLERKSMDVDAA